jgi:hypothetical protein
MAIKLELQSFVVAGILPAIEPGVPPGGKAVHKEQIVRRKISKDILTGFTELTGFRMGSRDRQREKGRRAGRLGSTAGGTPATTTN